MLLLPGAITSPATGGAQSGDLSPGVLQLSRRKHKVREALDRLENCACLETVERWIRPRGADIEQFLDRTRLEVTDAGEKELLSWPGGAHFEEGDVRRLVSSGMFTSEARLVLLNEQATFQYWGPEDLKGRHAIRYDFRIPSFAQAYKLRSGNNWAWVAARGSFWF